MTTPNPYDDPYRYPFVVALAPTFRHPELLANSLALWNMQDYPAERRELLILDDGQTFDQQLGSNWALFSKTTRRPSLPAKYNELLHSIGPVNPSYVLVWEDDDIYFPGYVSAHADCLRQHEFSKPDWVYSDYINDEQGKPIIEAGQGRFHSSMGFRYELISRIGGWVETKRADFDQQLLGKLHGNAQSTGTPWQRDNIQYLYGWHTGAAHCQSTMRSPDDETWYDRGEEAYAKVPYVGKLAPKLDVRTKRIFDKLGVSYGDQT